MPLGQGRSMMAQPTGGAAPAQQIAPSPEVINSSLESFLAGMKGKAAGYRIMMLKHIIDEMLVSPDELAALVQDIAGQEDLNTYLASRPGVETDKK